jgi:hypothetical protein
MTKVSNEVLREWVGVLDQVANCVAPARPVPDDLAEELQHVIDEMEAISEGTEPVDSGRQQDSGMQTSEKVGEPEQIGSAILRRLREIQQRSSQ